LKNVKYTGASPLEKDTVKKLIADEEKALSGKGRLFIRASGTEPLIRVMAEGEDKGQIESAVDRICKAVAHG
jgi:phosphoglucosamine mutase